MQIVIDIPDHYYENNIKKELPIILSEDNIIALLPKGHGKIGDLSELETRIGNFIEHCKNPLEETNPNALVYMNHILDGIKSTDTIIEADKGLRYQKAY